MPLPQEILDVVFLEEDEKLDFAGRVEKAQSLVFSSDYRDTKDMIDCHTNNFLNAIVTWTRGRQTESAKALKTIIQRQRLCFSIFFVISAITFYLDNHVDCKASARFCNMYKRGEKTGDWGSPGVSISGIDLQ